MGYNYAHFVNNKTGNTKGKVTNMRLYYQFLVNLRCKPCPLTARPFEISVSLLRVHSK